MTDEILNEKTLMLTEYMIPVFLQKYKLNTNFTQEYKTTLIFVMWFGYTISQDLLVKMCPDVMKLGLLHEIKTLKTSLGDQPCYVSFEVQSLQELAAAIYITQVLDETRNMKVSAT